MGKFIFIKIVLIFSCQINAGTITDPTRPMASSENSVKNKKINIKSKQVLSAIFIKQGIKQAIINNQFYKQGDYYRGKKIISIQKNKVVLKNNLKISELLLIKPIKKLIHKKN